jgi:hypothetical protein
MVVGEKVYVKGSGDGMVLDCSYFTAPLEGSEEREAILQYTLSYSLSISIKRFRNCFPFQGSTG